MTPDTNTMEKIIGRQNFALLSSQNILKMEPIIEVDKFVEKVEELIVEGHYEDALMYLKVLKDPQVFVMRGLVSKIRESFSTSMIENRIRSDIERMMLEEGRRDTIQAAYDTMVLINQELTLKDKITMIKKGIVIMIVSGRDLKNKSGGGYNVVAAKYVPSYTVEYKSSKTEGIWKFPECFLSVDISTVGNTDKLSINEGVYIIRPKGYMHPFVFRDGKMCLGTFSKTAVPKGKTSTAFRLIDLYLSAGEQVLKSGYTNKRFTPANGRLHDEKYRKFKISDKVSENYNKIEDGARKIKRMVNGK